MELISDKQKYDVVYCDPPWKYKMSRQGAAAHHYDTMSLADLKKLPVPDIASPDCALLMWTTGPKLPEAIQLMEAWGFKYKTVFFVWIKKNKTNDNPCNGLGHWTRSSAEFCLLGTKGNPRRYQHSHSVQQTIIEARREHSRKPDVAVSRIEAFFGPNTKKIELFARQHRPGWTTWGNETDKFD